MERFRTDTQNGAMRSLHVSWTSDATRMTTLGRPMDIVRIRSLVFFGIALLTTRMVVATHSLQPQSRCSLHPRLFFRRGGAQPSSNGCRDPPPPPLPPDRGTWKKGRTENPEPMDRAFRFVPPPPPIQNKGRQSSPMGRPNERFLVETRQSVAPLQALKESVTVSDPPPPPYPPPPETTGFENAAPSIDAAIQSGGARTQSLPPPPPRLPAFPERYNGTFLPPRHPNEATCFHSDIIPPPPPPPPGHPDALVDGLDQDQVSDEDRLDEMDMTILEDSLILGKEGYASSDHEETDEYDAIDEEDWKLLHSSLWFQDSGTAATDWDEVLCDSILHDDEIGVGETSSNDWTDAEDVLGTTMNDDDKSENIEESAI